MRWVLDKNKSIKMRSDWTQVVLEAYDIYEMLKKSRKFRYDYYITFSDKNEKTLLAYMIEDSNKRIALEKYTDGKREYLVVTYFEIEEFPYGKPVCNITSKLIYRTETPFEEQRRKESHSSYVIDSSKSDPEFDNPAWGDYIKGE